jgi:hypothetical protein
LNAECPCTSTEGFQREGLVPVCITWKRIGNTVHFSFFLQAASKSSLRNHLTDSHEDLCYKCKKCVYKSTTYGALARHMRSVHKVGISDCRPLPPPRSGPPLIFFFFLVLYLNSQAYWYSSTFVVAFQESVSKFSYSRYPYLRRT